MAITEALKKGDKVVVVDKKPVKLTNSQKIYWPEEGISKGELVSYYRDMSSYILPYIKNRPQSLNRFPNGIKAPGFYQKDMDVSQVPSWVKTEKIFSTSNNDYIDYLICNDTATLMYMANLGCIEINPWHSQYKKPNHPQWMMLDLDPGDISFGEVVKVALQIRKAADELEIESFCKTSGASGLHIFFPLNTKYAYDEVKPFAAAFANLINQRIPETTSIERSVAKRRDKVYLDFLQNNKGQTIAAPYSVRPRPGATVSAPLAWSEVNARLHPGMFTMKNIKKRVETKGDLWEGVMGAGIPLKKLAVKINSLLKK